MMIATHSHCRASALQLVQRDVGNSLSTFDADAPAVTLGHKPLQALSFY